MFAGGINGALGGVADQSAGQKGGCTQAELTRLGEVAGEIVDLAEAAITLIDRLLDLSNPVYQSEALTATKLLGVNMYEYRTGEVAQTGRRLSSEAILEEEYDPKRLSVAEYKSYAARVDGALKFARSK